MVSLSTPSALPKGQRGPGCHQAGSRFQSLSFIFLFVCLFTISACAHVPRCAQGQKATFRGVFAFACQARESPVSAAALHSGAQLAHKPLAGSPVWIA